MSKTLGECMRKFRAIAGLTLRQVEEACGVSNAYLSQLENDKIKTPSAHVLYKISQLYGIKIDVFLFAAGIITDDPQIPAISSVGGLEPHEEKELLEYLAFLRSKKKALRPPADVVTTVDYDTETALKDALHDYLIEVLKQKGYSVGSEDESGKMDREIKRLTDLAIETITHPRQTITQKQ